MTFDVQNLPQVSRLTLSGLAIDVDAAWAKLNAQVTPPISADIRNCGTPGAVGKSAIKALQSAAAAVEFDGWEDLILDELYGVLQPITDEEIDIYAALFHAREFYPRLDREWCLVLRLGAGSYSLPTTTGRTPKWFTPNGQGTSQLVLDQERSVLATDDLLSDITSLDLSGIPLMDGNGLARLTNLQSINLANTGLPDVTPLESLPLLNDVDLSGNGLPAASVGRMIGHLIGRGAGSLKLRGNTAPSFEVADDLITVINEGTLVELDDSLIEFEVSSGDFTPLIEKTGTESISWRLPDGSAHTDPGTQSITTGGTVAVFSPDLATATSITLQNVSDLGIIGDLTNLQTLDIDGGSFTDVSTLLGLASLTTVRITNNASISAAAVAQLVDALDSHGLTNGTLDLAGTPGPVDQTALNSLESKGWSFTGIATGSLLVGAGDLDLTVTTVSGNPIVWELPDGELVEVASGDYLARNLSTGGVLGLQAMPLDVVGIEMYGDIQDTTGLNGFTSLVTWKIGALVPERLSSYLTSLYHCNEPNSTDPLIDSLGVYDVPNNIATSRVNGAISLQKHVGPAFLSDQYAPHLSTGNSTLHNLYGFLRVKFDDLNTSFGYILHNGGNVNGEARYYTWRLTQGNDSIKLSYRIGGSTSQSVGLDIPDTTNFHLIEFYSIRWVSWLDPKIGIAIDGGDFVTKTMDFYDPPGETGSLVISNGSLTHSSSNSFAGDISILGFANDIASADLATGSTFRQLVEAEAAAS